MERSTDSTNLAIGLLRSRPRGLTGAIIVVILGETIAADSNMVFESVPQLVANGADDVAALPKDATEWRVSISLSVAKAQAHKESRSRLQNQLRDSRKQCDELFWKIADEIVEDFPALQPDLIEVCERRVGDMDLVQKLGKGQYGSVFRWQSRKDDGSGAVKIIPKASISSADEALQLATEASVLKRLNHSSIIYLEKFLHGLHCMYLCVEFAGTRTLFQRINCGMTWSTAEGIFSQVASGVAHCHENNVAHCDLKPENIVISGSGDAKIVDFGQAVDLAEVVQPLQFPRGTMPFVAPELLRLSRTWNPAAADVWSLGVILVEMLSGNNAFMRLMGWTGDFSRPMWEKCAERLEEFVSSSTEAHANTFKAISEVCKEEPPPDVIRLIGNMLEFAQEDRASALQIRDSFGRGES
jgi:hypothetical protein